MPDSNKYEVQIDRRIYAGNIPYVGLSIWNREKGEWLSHEEIEQLLNLSK